MRIRWIILIMALSAGGLSAQDRPDVEDLKRQLQELRTNFERMQRLHEEQVNSLSRKLQELENRSLTNRVTVPELHTAQSAPPLVPPGSQTRNSYMDLGLVGTFAAGTSTADHIQGGTQPGGHDPNQRGFTVQGVEASFSGAIDPYFRGSANVLFGLDAGGESYLELEEAWLETVSLPANLQLRAGQLMTEFGRANPTHPHAWAFADTPLVLARFMGPDGLRNPGARVSWLAPTPFYSELLFTVQDSHGETAASFRSSGDAHGGKELFEVPFAYRHSDNDRGIQHATDLLFTPRYVISIDITDDQVLMLGGSGAFGPNSSGGGGDTSTHIFGLDLTWKWKASNHHGGFPFLSFQTEALLRNYEAGAFDWADEENPLLDPATDLPAFLAGETLTDYGFYTQILYGFRKGWVAGTRFDYVDGEKGSYERRGLTMNGVVLGRDVERSERWRVSPNLTWYPSEFSKIRLQYNLDRRRDIGTDHSVWLQFEFLLGAHAAHTF